MTLVVSFPGTTERVCLIIGSLPAVRQVMHYIMERVFEKPDPNPKPTGDGRLNMERHKQASEFSYIDFFSVP